MNKLICPSSIKTKLHFISFAVILFCSCTKHAFSPVNEGREYGNPKVPILISHVSQNNRKVLDRTGHHSYIQKLLCFNYACRRIVGRQKVSGNVSLAHFEKQVRKNARKGLYKKLTPKPADVSPDTIPVVKRQEPILNNEPAPTVTSPILKTDSLITLSDFLFETNRYQLKAEQLSALDNLAKFLLSHPTLEVGVSGHTDNIGKERDNVSLSTRRAESVAKYLINTGVLDKQVSFEGFGSSRPINGNETEEGRSKNRRVEILIHNPANN